MLVRVARAVTNGVPAAELAAISVAVPAAKSVAASAGGRCLEQLLCQYVPLPHFVHLPSVAYFV